MQPVARTCTQECCRGKCLSQTLPYLAQNACPCCPSVFNPFQGLKISGLRLITPPLSLPAPSHIAPFIFYTTFPPLTHPSLFPLTPAHPSLTPHWPLSNPPPAGAQQQAMILAPCGPPMVAMAQPQAWVRAGFLLEPFTYNHGLNFGNLWANI